MELNQERISGQRITPLPTLQKAMLGKEIFELRLDGHYETKSKDQ